MLFFKLPTGIGASSGREVGKLFLYALLTAATAIPKRQRRQTYLLLDEFQELVSTDLDVFFAQASGADIAVIAANQSNSQLLQVSPHFLMALQDNTHLEIVFSASNADAIRDLSYRSGEVYHETMSLSFGETPGGSTSQESFHENIGPRARVNDILRFSARPGHCRVTVRANDALAQFDGRSFEMRTMYHIGEQEFERRENAPWPKDTGTIPMPLPATPTRSMDAASNDRGATRDPGSATTAATPALDDVPFEFDDDSNEP